MTTDAFGRELLQIVEIDYDFCDLVYGDSPCTAALGTTGVRKCYNTRKTCQDPENYQRGTLTLRFARNQDGLPKGVTVYPVLKDVSTRAGKINFSGFTRREGPLGSRAEVTIRLGDFADSDFETDKYRDERVSGDAQTDEGGYRPEDRGTFWAKLRARQPFVVGRSLRVREGYVGQDFGDMRTRHYVITQIDGPSGTGGVQIRAKDVLDLADNEKAVAPAPSLGRLSEDIDEEAEEFELLGDPSEYPTSGRVSLGSEVITYTRSGSTFTLTRRGADGTEAASHSEGDSVQLCLRFTNRTIPSVGRDLLQDFADVPSGFIPFADWQAESARWQAGYRVTRTITKPTGVTTLLAELSVFGVYWFWDEVDQKIRLSVNRPIDLWQGESLQPLIDEPDADKPDAANLMKETASAAYPEDQRLSKVFLWHGQLDPTGSTSDRANFARLAVAATVPDEDKYDQERVREIYTPWLGIRGDDTIAEPTATRLLLRYADTPRVLTGNIDAKDAGKVELADLVEVVSRVISDETGKPEPSPMQVRYVEEEIGGHRIKFEAETFAFDARYGFITENSRNDYGASTDDEKALGTYIVDENTLEFGDGSGPYVFF